jgi:hypothetical protein
MIAHEVIVHADPETIFSLYENIESWPQWDEEVAAVSLPDGLRENAQGWLQPRSGPRAKIQVASVTSPLQFSVESQLPGCKMVFDHRIEVIDTGTRVTHGVYFKGATSFVFAKLIGPSLNRGLPLTLQGLKREAEAMTK